MIRRWKDEPAAHDWDARVKQLLAEARELPNGPERSEALKKAEQLRIAADMKRLFTKPRE
ncbi:hypothetical protein SAMN05444159_7160 [Bradyrhizobium lablabi]|uniref:Uncharacterized protein n=1 Tax=Bradyrhizobium lablabi TaxID=722472 RepID=A0A1M7EH18_9BRAD|nr:hypothetical protein [Bradyrhizobium lablabi]SHL90906.1 hypothetical protein SAMN05444159_7160 [Bradyrhizobium lablabi]